MKRFDYATFLIYAFCTAFVLLVWLAVVAGLMALTGAP